MWLIRGIRRGVVITRYPARPDPSAATLPAPPAFRPRELTRQVADRLVAVCPGGALRRDGGVLVYDVGACTACGRCAREAPAAVTRSGDFELAITDRSVLIKRIPIGGEAT